MAIDKQAVANLEDFLYAHIENPRRAASMITNIIGVAIDLKPTALEFLYPSELKNTDLNDFLSALEPLGIKALFSHHETFTMGEFDWVEDICIFKDLTLAIEQRKMGDEINASMDDFGQTIDQQKWESATRRTGELLGYPATAIEYFLKDTDIDNPERMARMNRNRYYAHSPEHEEEEFQAYDLKLNQAIEEYAPKTAAIFKEESEKRWLS